MASSDRPDVPDSALHAIKDFDEVDAATLDRLRALRGYQRHAYLFELTDWSLHPRLEAFLRDVVDNPGAPRPPRGVLLVPELPVSDLLRRPLHSVLSSLGADGAPLQVEPDVELWRSGIEYAGAPAVLREDLADDWQPPEDVTTIKAGALPTRAAGDSLVGARRWLASRLAFAAGPTWTQEELLASHGVRPQEASHDARKALAALAAEAELGREDDVVPGFRAPDAVLRD